MCVCAHTHIGLGNLARLPAPVDFALLGVPECVKSNYPEAGPAGVPSPNPLILSPVHLMERNEVQCNESTAERLHGSLEPKVFLLFFLNTCVVPPPHQLQKEEYMKKMKVSLNWGCGMSVLTALPRYTEFMVILGYMGS